MSTNPQRFHAMMDIDAFPRVSARASGSTATTARTSTGRLERRDVRTNATRDPLHRFGLAGAGVLLASVLLMFAHGTGMKAEAVTTDTAESAATRIVGSVATTPGSAQPLRIYGTVDGTVGTSMAQAGAPAASIDQYMKVVVPFLDSHGIQKGDRFDLILDRTPGADGTVRLGNIMYAGLYRRDGRDLELSQWTRKGRLEWFDATKATQSYDVLQRPVPGLVTSRYGMREHPILGYSRMHRGVDFHASAGTPILAVQEGWVGHAGWEGSFGNQVELVHGAGLSTTYSHMSRVAVRPGTLVQQGQVIGWVGATGLATGPHLHYEVHQGGVAIDPSSISFSTTAQLQGPDLDGYERRLNALLAVPIGRTKA